MNGKKGYIVILNGVPRAGKTSIATEIQNTFDGVWINLGVDRYKAMIPDRYKPSVGLYLDGERPDLEPVGVTLYKALYESIAAHSRLGVNVAVDIVHHDSHTSPLQILPQCAKILENYPALMVGVKCPLDEIMRRRTATSYPSYDENGSILEGILKWQKSAHGLGIYDIEVDTSVNTPTEIAETIRDNLNESNFTAINRLANLVSEVKA